jgi:hypothetical protein
MLYAESGRFGLSSSLVVLLVLPFDLIDLELDALVGFLRGDRGDLLFFFVLLVPLADESSENLVKPVGSDDAAKRRSVYSAVGEEPGNDGALLSWRGGILFMVTCMYLLSLDRYARWRVRFVTEQDL